jgi:hypothetical protein
VKGGNVVCGSVTWVTGDNFDGRGVAKVLVNFLFYHFVY